MTYTFALVPQTYIRGLFVVQDTYDREEFKELITPHFPKRQLAHLQKTYDQELEEVQGACVFTSTQTQWLIVIFKQEPRDIRSVALHEIVHLADKLTSDRENRALFIEYAYQAFADDLDGRLAS